MDITLIADAIVAVLLAVTIFSMVTINRRLNQMRDGFDEMPRLLMAFNEATMRADAGIPKLRRAAEEASGLLQDRVEKAQLLRDDLAFMIERADSIANRLEDAVRQARVEIKTSESKLASASSMTAPAPMSRPATAARPAPATGPSTGNAAAPRAPTLPLEEPESSLDDERSEAERELLRALQAVR